MHVKNGWKRGLRINFLKKLTTLELDENIFFNEKYLRNLLMEMREKFKENLRIQLMEICVTWNINKKMIKGILWKL